MRTKLCAGALQFLGAFARTRVPSGACQGPATACGLASLDTARPARAFCATARDATPTELLRNFAIIAHVDHGKTTLMDTLLSHDRAAAGKADVLERAMDSGTFERERGITITSKYTSFPYKGFTLNAVDTPGHADFGGEVERILGMVDSCLLVVDVTEGPMAQTKFVLSKALRMGLHPLVVFNKIDRPTASQQQCDLVHSQLFDLFSSLGANDAQLDFPVIYASGKSGWATTEYPAGSGEDMRPLLDTIVEHVPPPRADGAAPFAMLVTMIERDNYLGRIATGRVVSGAVRDGDAIKSIPYADKPPEAGKVTRIMKRAGASGSQARPAANAGDIISLAGIASAAIGDTICAPAVTAALQPGQIDPPTLSMVFAPNSSPIGRVAGNVVTAQKILERLQHEAAQSVSLQVMKLPSEGGEERVQVHARGELQLGLLIEGMRRDRFEMEISAPQVLLRQEGGQNLEPLEEATMEVPEAAVGDVISSLQLRKGVLQDMQEAGGRCSLTVHVPTRGLIGYKGVFTSITRGEGLLNRAFLEYTPHMGPLDQVRKGALVSMADGRVTGYATNDLQARGTLFVKEGDTVYPGMIVGESSTENDIQVNPAREKKLSNMRTKQADEKYILAPPRIVTLEESIGYVQPDELIEVTPDAIRLRKIALTAAERKRALQRAAGG